MEWEGKVWNGWNVELNGLNGWSVEWNRIKWKRMNCMECGVEGSGMEWSGMEQSKWTSRKDWVCQNFDFDQLWINMVVEVWA